MSTKYEYYDAGDDNNAQVYGIIQIAQTFTPSESHKITSVKMKGYRTGSPGTIYVGIKATDGNGHPTSDDLCSGSTDGDTLPTGSPYEWREITLGDGYDLEASTKYAIVFHITGGDTGNCFYMRADSSSPSYAGGCMERSTNGGSSWTSFTNYDGMFEDWGESGGEHYERSGTALLGLVGAGSRDLGLARTGTGLLGLLPTGSRGLGLARSSVALLGLKTTGVMSTAAHYFKTGVAYLGLVATGSRTLALTRTKTALLGLKGTGSRTISITRVGTALLGLKMTGIMSAAKHYIRNGVAYLGLLATGSRSISLSRTGTALLGLKGIGSRTISISRTGIALLGLKATGIFETILLKIASARVYIIEVRNGDGDLIAILENARGIDYTQEINAPHSLRFEAPATDSKLSNILLSNEYWLRDTRTSIVVRKFKLQRKRDVR